MFQAKGMMSDGVIDKIPEITQLSQVKEHVADNLWFDELGCMDIEEVLSVLEHNSFVGYNWTMPSLSGEIMKHPLPDEEVDRIRKELSGYTREEEMMCNFNYLEDK